MLLAHLGPGSALLQVSWVYKVTGYEGRKLCIHPPLIEPRSRLLRVTCRAPQERWECDILEEEGDKGFKGMAEEIKQACATLTVQP